ncbi:MAG TPA: dihydrofolate reductase family protein, partial [Candidatus Acidoferrum sp.]|nr:dihydrofolate reductase family protein [Candidatus Acidoferrum sp.]
GSGVIKMNHAGAELVREASRRTGAIVTGRRTFDVANAWGGRHPMDVPVVVVTHRVPLEWAREGTIFTFVTDGVERAIETAQKIAGEKNVAIDGPSIAQQALKAGLVDEFQIDLAPVLLGRGIRLFDGPGIKGVQLENTGITAAPGVTHLLYRVVK